MADVYAAGEAPIDGIGRDALVGGFAITASRAAALASETALAPEILARTSPGDLVMCLGAGDITGWAARLPAEMDRLREDGA